MNYFPMYCVETSYTLDLSLSNRNLRYYLTITKRFLFDKYSEHVHASTERVNQSATASTLNMIKYSAADSYNRPGIWLT